MVAEETILKKLEGMPRGEKISLARRGTGRLAASLLYDPDQELIRAALDNPYLTEGHLLKVLAREGLPPAVVEQLPSTRDGRITTICVWRSSAIRLRLSPGCSPSFPTWRSLTCVTSAWTTACPSRCASTLRPIAPPAWISNAVFHRRITSGASPVVRSYSLRL